MAWQILKQGCSPNDGSPSWGKGSLLWPLTLYSPRASLSVRSGDVPMTATNSMVLATAAVIALAGAGIGPVRAAQAYVVCRREGGCDGSVRASDIGGPNHPNRTIV